MRTRTAADTATAQVTVADEACLLRQVEERAVKPPWMRWFCAADDLYWDGAQRTCWFCGTDGAAASAPRLTSQHGFGPELAE